MQILAVRIMRSRSTPISDRGPALGATWLKCGVHTGDHTQKNATLRISKIYQDKDSLYHFSLTDAKVICKIQYVQNNFNLYSRFALYGQILSLLFKFQVPSHFLFFKVVKSGATHISIDSRKEILFSNLLCSSLLLIINLHACCSSFQHFYLLSGNMPDLKGAT